MESNSSPEAPRALPQSVDARLIQGANHISSIDPISPVAEQDLKNAGVTAHEITRVEKDQQLKIDRQAKKLGNIVLQTTYPSELNPDSFTDPNDPSPILELDNRKRIETINGTEYIDPKAALQKLASDGAEVMTFLQLLGPTNTLMSARGYDASFELGRLIHTLEADWASTNETDRDPSLRMPEAYLREELALLWSPKSLDYATGKTGNVPKVYRELVANPADPNVFTTEELETLSDEERWVLVGSKLCDEAADIFEFIATQLAANSPKDSEGHLTELGTNEQYIEMSTRAYSMRIRSLQLQLQITKDEAKQLDIKEQIASQHEADSAIVIANYRYLMPQSDTQWSKEASQRLGPAFEQLLLSEERNDLFLKGNYTDHARLATVREDKIDKEILQIRSQKTGTVQKLSKDIVIDDLTGKNTARYLQAKHKKERNYNQLNDRRIAYPQAEMRFLESLKR